MSETLPWLAYLVDCAGRRAEESAAYASFQQWLTRRPPLARGLGPAFVVFMHSAGVEVVPAQETGACAAGARVRGPSGAPRLGEALDDLARVSVLQRLPPLPPTLVVDCHTPPEGAYWMTAGRRLSVLFRGAIMPRFLCGEPGRQRGFARELLGRAGRHLGSRPGEPEWRLLEALSRSSYARCARCGAANGLLPRTPAALPCWRCGADVRPDLLVEGAAGRFGLRSGEPLLHLHFVPGSIRTSTQGIVRVRDGDPALVNKGQHGWRSRSANGIDQAVPPGHGVTCPDHLEMDFGLGSATLRNPQRGGLTRPMEETEFLAHPRPLYPKDHCAACRGALGNSYTIVGGDHSARFCARCVAEAPRCHFCGFPVGGGGGRLAYGRAVCEVCLADGVKAPSTMEALHRQARAFFARYLHAQLRPPQTCPVHLVSTARLGRSVSGSGQDIRERVLREPAVFIFRRWNDPHTGPTVDGTEIRVERGHPANSFYGMLVHELTHLWQVDGFPDKASLTWIEGVACWVQVKALQQAGAFSEAGQLGAAVPDLYRTGLGWALTVEARVGFARTLAECARLAQQGTPP